MKEIFLWLIDRAISVIPGLLLRLFYNPGKVANDVKISLRGELPINPSLNSSVPHLDLYLEITNLSNLNLIVDRVLIDLWFGQPVLRGAILERHRIPSRSSGTQLFFRTDLTSSQIDQIKPYLTDSPPGGSISLSTIAYFDSKIGVIEVERSFERRKI